MAQEQWTDAASFSSTSVVQQASNDVDTSSPMPRCSLGFFDMLLSDAQAVLDEHPFASGLHAGACEFLTPMAGSGEGMLSELSDVLLPLQARPLGP